MNARLAIGSDAELADGFEPVDDLDKIPLSWRFRPFSQPGERRALFVFGDDEQGFQCRNRLRRQAFDEALVSVFAGESAPRQGDLFQSDGGGQQYAPLAQIFDHSRDNDVAAIRPRRLFDRDMSKGAPVVTAKGANVEIGLEFAEVLPARFFTTRISCKLPRITFDLRGYEGKHLERRRFVRARHASG